MNTNEPLTDAQLEAMLTRLAARGGAEGLAASIMAVVETTPQQRRRWISLPDGRLMPAPEPRPLWLLVVLGLLLALAAGTLIVGSRLLTPTKDLPLRLPALVPSGIETLSDTVTYEKTVIDGQGILWAAGEGRLSRYDPGTGTGRTWTIDDDLRFAATTGGPWFYPTRIIPARTGGVWLIGTRTLLRFDGVDVREEVELDADLNAAAEAPDGTLWVATTDDVVHLVGSSRVRVAASHPVDVADIAALAVDAAGNVWCGGTGWVSRYDGTGWQTFGAQHAAPLGHVIRVITPLPDGSVWVGTETGLASFVGSTWTEVGVTEPIVNLTEVTSVAAGADGSIWTGFGTSVVARHGNGGWTSYGAADGLPVEEARGSWAWVLPAGSRTFAGIGPGIYELAGDRWTRVWPETTRTGPDDPSRIVAMSRDEAWVTGNDAVWRYADGAWSESLTAGSDGGIRDLLHTPGGDLWLAAGDGLHVRSGSVWTKVSEEPAAGLGVGPDGRVWTIGPEEDTVRAYALVDGRWTEHARLTADLTGLMRIRWLGCLAFEADGTLWSGSGDGWGGGGLVRYADGAWELVNPRGGDGEFIVTDLAVTPNGDLWAVGADMTVTPTVTRTGEHWIARFDGSAWEVFTDAETPAAEPASDLAIAPDGSLWVATREGLAHFDGRSWSTVHPGIAFDAVAVAPDGTLWVNSPSGVGRLAEVPGP